jgi:hypothetical protein
METICIGRAAPQDSLSSVRDEIRELLVVRQHWNLRQSASYALLAKRELQLLTS